MASTAPDRNATNLGRRWVIVLAAGEGSRLRGLTDDGRGGAVPKQFCSLRGGQTLLEETLARAGRLVPRERIVVVVAAEHVAHWHPQLAGLPAGNVVVQPRNRGTCPGLLLPLLSILRRDPEATVLVLPSDHFIADEAAFAAAAGEALDAAGEGHGQTVLLGVAAQRPATDYGWIVPAGHARPGPVASFVEKPLPAEAARLFAQGAVWNTFVFAARGRSLIDLVEACLPGLAGGLADAQTLGGDTLSRFYDVLPASDLSRAVLQRLPSRLSLLRAPACGWTDLGTPERVRECLATLPPARRGGSWWRPEGRVDLSRRLAGELTAVGG